MATTYTDSTTPILSADGTRGGAVTGASSKISLYGGTPLARVSLTQLATTKTTTQLRAELSALQDALDNLEIITIT